MIVHCVSLTSTVDESSCVRSLSFHVITCIWTTGHFPMWQGVFILLGEWLPSGKSLKDLGADQRSANNVQNRVQTFSVQAPRSLAALPLGSLYLIFTPTCESWYLLVKGLNRIPLPATHTHTHVSSPPPPTEQGYTVRYRCVHIVVEAQRKVSVERRRKCSVIYSLKSMSFYVN